MGFMGGCWASLRRSVSESPLGRQILPYGLWKVSSSSAQRGQSLFCGDGVQLQRSQGVERGNRRDECRSGEVVEAHHEPRLVAIPADAAGLAGDDAGEVEAEDDEPHRGTRAGQLLHEP